MANSTTARAVVQADDGTPNASRGSVTEQQELVLLHWWSEIAMKSMTTTSPHARAGQVSEAAAVKAPPMDSTAERAEGTAGEARHSASKKPIGLSLRKGQGTVLLHQHGVESLGDTTIKKSTLSMVVLALRL